MTMLPDWRGVAVLPSCEASSTTVTGAGVVGTAATGITGTGTITGGGVSGTTTAGGAGTELSYIINCMPLICMLLSKLIFTSTFLLRLIFFCSAAASTALPLTISLLAAGCGEVGLETLPGTDE